MSPDFGTPSVPLSSQSSQRRLLREGRGQGKRCVWWSQESHSELGLALNLATVEIVGAVGWSRSIVPGSQGH